MVLSIFLFPPFLDVAIQSALNARIHSVTSFPCLFSSLQDNDACRYDYKRPVCIEVGQKLER